MFYDTHTHTKFSTDSTQEPEEMINAALKNDVGIYCFTDHQDFDFPYDDIKFDVDKEEYFNTLVPLKNKYKDKLDIRIGIEIGLEEQHFEKLDNYVNQSDFEFVIGSIHLIKGKDPYYPVFFEGKNEEKVFEEFFLETLKLVKGYKNFDVLGHLDYIVRYAPNKDKNYSYSKFGDIIDEILKELINTGRGIEANSAGFRKGLTSPNPCFDVLKRYNELGGDIITTGSDAHFAKDVCADFKKLYEMLQKAGFKYVTAFKERKAEFYKL